MNKKPIIIPLKPEDQDQNEGQSVVVDALLSTLTDIDKELENHLNPDYSKSNHK